MPQLGRRLCEFAVLLGALLGSQAGATGSGLLLGTDADRTYWIYPSHSGIAVLEIPGLIVPRDRGFWKLERAYMVQTEPSFSEDPPYTRGAEAWSFSPVGRPLPPRVPEGWRLVPGWDGLDLCEEQRKVIRFLGPRLVAFEDVGSFQCGPHPEGYSERRTARIDRWESERIGIEDLLGEPGRSAFDAAFGSATQAYFAAWEDRHCGEPSTDHRSWVITRDRGRWLARGWAETHRLCGGGFEFEVAVALPESLVGRDRLPLVWSEIEAVVPGAFDAMASPQGDLLVVLTPTSLVAFRPSEQGIGTPIGHHAFHEAVAAEPGPASGGGARVPVEQAVLIEWATGRYVPIWTENLSKLVRR